MIAQPMPVRPIEKALPDEKTRPSLHLETGLSRFFRRFRRDDNAATTGSVAGKS